MVLVYVSLVSEAEHDVTIASKKMGYIVCVESVCRTSLKGMQLFSVKCKINFGLIKRLQQIKTTVDLIEMFVLHCNASAV